MTVERLSLADRQLSYQRQVGLKNFSGVIFLSGFASNMDGIKATFLSRRAEERGIPFVRFDYSGCGKSAGKFSEGTIGRWLEDSLNVFDKLTEGPQIVVGSSMGGWLALLLARQRAERVKALVGVAAAPDFTEDLIWSEMSNEERETLLRDGVFYEKTDPERRAPITRTLIHEARSHLVLRSPLRFDFPVRLLQGMNDKDVPWACAVRLAERISCDDLRLTLIKKGDHSLGRAEDLELLWETIEKFL
ncbi:MAG: alpha/beta hydrolase [Alphaproteobacteria bacterium]|nr:alpha/beta hydrolase [Alphaproteobacteria bacterium]